MTGHHQMPCCDVRKTSTGSLRTLAAGLTLLNCPEHPPSAPVDRACARPAKPYVEYDLSQRPEDVRLLKPSSCQKTPADRSKLAGCVSRGQMLVQFNDGYDRDGVPDLRRNVRTGKRHQFTDDIHSQVLRGTTISQA